MGSGICRDVYGFFSQAQKLFLWPEQHFELPSETKHQGGNPPVVRVELLVESN